MNSWPGLHVSCPIRQGRPTCLLGGARREMKCQARQNWQGVAVITGCLNRPARGPGPLLLLLTAQLGRFTTAIVGPMQKRYIPPFGIVCRIRACRSGKWPTVPSSTPATMPCLMERSWRILPSIQSRLSGFPKTLPAVRTAALRLTERLLRVTSSHAEFWMVRAVCLSARTQELLHNAGWTPCRQVDVGP